LAALQNRVAASADPEILRLRDVVEGLRSKLAKAKGYYLEELADREKLTRRLEQNGIVATAFAASFGLPKSEVFGWVAENAGSMRESGISAGRMCEALGVSYQGFLVWKRKAKAEAKAAK
jgi:hypothetical protein